MGSAAAGMFPVWYDNPEVSSPWTDHGEVPDCEHLRIRDWAELIRVLDEM